MKVVIDTNVLLMSIPKIYKYRIIFDELIFGKYDLLITEDIFFEYKEIIGKKTTGKIAQNLGDFLVQQNNVQFVKVYFKWRLIVDDYDDNKFVDCAIAGNAKYIVSNDHHFNILKQVRFPAIEVVSIDDFLKILTSG